MASLVLDVGADTTPPFGTRYVADAALQVAAAEPGSPLFLVAHSGAGYLLPPLGSTERAAGRAVRGYVFVDAGLPSPKPTNRLALLHAEDPAMGQELEGLLATGQSYPSWDEEDLRELVPDQVGP